MIPIDRTSPVGQAKNYARLQLRFNNRNDLGEFDTLNEDVKAYYSFLRLQPSLLIIDQLL